MKRLAACLLALVLLLSGCTEGSYVSVKPHQGENTSGNAQAVAVGNYEEMLAALKEMVAGAVEQQVLSVADMDENAVDGYAGTRPSGRPAARTPWGPTPWRRSPTSRVRAAICPLWR